MPIDRTHPFAGYLTSEQDRSYQSGDEKAMAAADARALKDAIEVSLKETPRSCKAVVQRATGVAASAVDPRIAHENLAKSAEADLNRRGFQLVKARNCAPNCLLVALVQHATRKYDEQLSSSLSSQVAQWRDKLVKKSQECCKRGERKAPIGTNDRLHADDPLIPWLVDEILGAELRVDFYCADVDGTAVNFRSAGEGKNSVKIFDCGGTFKAIIPGNQNRHAQHMDRRA